MVTITLVMEIGSEKGNLYLHEPLVTRRPVGERAISEQKLQLIGGNIATLRST